MGLWKNWSCLSQLLLVTVTALYEDWLHCTVLDSKGKYRVCWTTSDAQITFGVDVQTRGYVGFGISPNGGMTGSDIVTGWVKNGEINFQDRHGVGNTLPEIDSRTDWELLNGYENDTHTSLVFRRKLDTCDKEDIEIDDSTTRLIYAYSDEDPPSVNGLQYHFKKRGGKSVLLLQQGRRHLPSTDHLMHWDILSPNFTITSKHSSMYWCKIFRTPMLAVKHHIVLAKPLIQEGHESYVHHLLLYECVGANAEEYDPHLDKVGHRCHHPNMPDAMKRCEGIAFAWAIGGEDLVLPDNVGIPMESGFSKYYMLEVHYDNPFYNDGVVDHSGFRLYYTPHLREHDGGSLMIGATISPRSFVPPKQKEYVVAGHSNPDCLGPVMPKEGIKILGVFMHSHLLGRRLKARHFRGTTELQPLANDKNYDFNYQEYRYYSEEVKFLPDDQITMECTYDSSDRNVTTFGGESTRDEMCLVFLLYYPRIERFASLSVPTDEEINNALVSSLGVTGSRTSGLFRFLSSFDWQTANVQEIGNALRYGQHNTHCYLGNGDKNSIISLISYPKHYHPYEEKLSCVQEEFLKGKRPTDKTIKRIQQKVHNGCGLVSFLYLNIILILSFHFFSRSCLM